ncbi:MAG: hypothetical protein AB7H90_01075 [Alphaproteobacteria bacterium]
MTAALLIGIGACALIAIGAVLWDRLSKIRDPDDAPTGRAPQVRGRG